MCVCGGGVYEGPSLSMPVGLSTVSLPGPLGIALPPSSASYVLIGNVSGVLQTRCSKQYWLCSDRIHAVPAVTVTATYMVVSYAANTVRGASFLIHIV